MVYTSYFGGLKKLKADPSRVICVARYLPRELNCKQALELAPTAELLKEYKAGRLTDLDYVLKYKAEVLDKLDPAEIVAKYDNMILCCYEKPTDLCHRHCIRLWLTAAGYSCEELGFAITDVWPICLDKQ